MPAPVLVEITSDSGLLLRVTGPLTKAGMLSIPGAAGFLSADASSGPTVQICGDDGALIPQVGSAGPRLFEDTAYKVLVEDPGGRSVKLVSPGPDVLSGADSLLGHPNLISADLNFRSSVGFSTITAAAGDGERVSATVLVFPTKLDFQTDYESLLSDVADLARGLVFRYSGSVHRLASAGTSTPSSLEWAILLRLYLADLDAALTYISRRPHRNLVREDAFVDVDHIRRPTSETYAAIRHQRGRGPLVNALGMTMRRELPVSIPNETTDNPENRWLRAQVLDIRRRLVVLKRDTAKQRDEQDKAGRDAKRINRDLEELASSEVAVSRMLEREPLRGATSLPPPGFSSLALMSRPGYREAYRALTALRSSLALDIGELQVPLERISTLYEYWCYLRLAGAILDLGGRLGGVEGFVRFGERGLSVSLSRDKASQIQFQRGQDRFTLRYGATWNGPTGMQKPDIVIEVDADGWSPLLIVLDAKYRVDASKETLDRFGGAAPPLEAVNVLHRYRDAIVDATAGRRLRPVVRGAALFPLGGPESAGYEARPLYVSLRSLGIGALPFLPSNSDIALKWLEDLVATRPLALSDGIPAPSGHVERWRRLVEELQPVLVLAPPTRADWETLVGTGNTIVLPSVREAADRFTSVVAVGPSADGAALVRIARIVRSSGSPASVEVETWAESRSLECDVDLPEWSIATALASRLARRTSDLGLGSSAAHDLVDQLPVIAPPDVAIARTAAGWLMATVVASDPAMELVVTGHQTWLRDGSALVPVPSLEAQ